jgi:type I restriction enzyme S subunit
MIPGLKPYPEYKDSRVPWLERIPADWRALRGKNVFRAVDVRSESGDEELLTVSSKDGVVPRSQKVVTMFKAESYVGHKLCWPGDLVINSLWAWAQGLGFSRHHGLVSSAYGVYRTRPEFAGYTSYFHHALRSAAYMWELRTRSRGVWLSRLELSDSSFVDMAILVPPLPEQSAIVRLLDHVDRRIRRYIRAKQKLIALLHEQRQAIVHRAVTRGLDPDVRLKPSGVEWLGDVPEHWLVSRVKNEFECLDRRRVPLNSTQRGAMTVRSYDYYGASGVIDKVDDYIFDKELLLIAEDGANLVLRNLPLAIVARGKFWVNNHAHVLRPRRGNLGFLAGLMESLSYLPWISGAAQPKLTQDRLFGIAIAVPPPEEQDGIMLRTTEETAPIDSAIAQNARGISLLREYRTRLIADVVTGKLDVREAAARLPVEVEEPEPLDDTDTSPEDISEETEAPDPDALEEADA